MDANFKKSIAAFSSVVWSALLTLMKLVVGLMTGSLGILSEALHSALDLVAAGGTLFAVKVAAQPADDEHPYGHGRVENLMALGEALLLLGTAAWVIVEAAERLLSDNPDAALHVELSIWAFAVVIVSIVVDVNRARMLYRVARETKSAALEADAAHFASDIWSSLAVLTGLCCVALAPVTEPGSWQHWLLMRADVFASVAVALFILHICWELGREAVANLMDKADTQAASDIRRLMKENMPAYPVHRIRVREVGNKPYVDMVVLVPRELHVDTAHDITEAIEALVERHLPQAETILHVEPSESLPDTPEFIIRRIALTHRFGVHGLVLMHADEGFLIFADLELPKDAEMDSWQVAIQAFRNEVKRHLQADAVVVHVEPQIRELPHFSRPLPPQDEWHGTVRRAMIELGAPLPSDISTFNKGDKHFCIVSIPPEPSLTVEQSHTRLTQLTKRLAAALPDTARFIVTYHGCR